MKGKRRREREVNRKAAAAGPHPPLQLDEKGRFLDCTNFAARRKPGRRTHGPLFRTGGAWTPLPVCEYSYVVTCVACRSLSSVYDFQRFTEETCFFASFL